MRIREQRVCIHCRALGVKIIARRHKNFFYCPACKKISTRFFEIAGKTKVTKTQKGLKHYSAGALIERDGKFLISKRTFYPYVYNVIGGHVDTGEGILQALKREVREETGLRVKFAKLIYAGIIFPDRCSRGVDIHDWHLYLVQTLGKVKINRHESVTLRWLTKKQMARLPFNPPVEFIFRKIKFFKT